MRKFLLLSLFLTTHSCYSQTDSLRYKLGQLQSAVIYMRDNLKKSHAEFKNGLIMSVGGAIITGLGIAIKPETNGDGTKDNSVKNIVTYGGAFFLVLGSIIMIDSHKFIGRAGRWKFSGTTITFDL